MAQSLGTALLNPTAIDPNIDPETGLPKSQGATAPSTFTLPTTQPGATTPLQTNQLAATAPVQSGVNLNAPLGSQSPKAPTQGAQGQALVNQAQQQASQGTQTGTQQLVTKQTQNLLNDPTQGMDWNRFTQNQMDQFNQGRAKDIEALRQQTANTANTGANLQNLLSVALQTTTDRANLQAQLAKEASEAKQQSLGQAITAGQNTANLEQQTLGNQLANLNTAYNMGQTDVQNQMFLTSQYLSQQGQQALAVLNGKIASGQQVSQQDFQAAQAQLDRELATAQQTNNIKAQQEITKLQASLNMQAQQQAQQFTAQQTSLQQAFEKSQLVLTQQGQQQLATLNGQIQSGQLVSQQDFTAAQNQLNRELDLAKQRNDIAAQQNITQLQASLNMAAQKQAQEFQMNLKSVDLAGQKELMTLQGQIDTGKLLTQEDFAKSEDVLKAGLVEAQAQNDFPRQQALMTLQSQLDKQKQDAQNQWQSAERIASEAFTTKQTLSQQDFQSAQAYLDRQQQTAIQGNDIEAQKYLAQKNTELQLAMQTNGFNEQEKQLYIQQQIQTAKDNNDFAHASQLQTISDNAQMTRLVATQGFQAVQQAIQNNFTSAMSDKDYTHAAALQTQQLQFKAMEDLQTTAIEQAKVALQAKGIDMQAIQQKFDEIETLEASGQSAPGSAVDYLNQQLSGTGVTIAKPDPLQQSKDIQKQYDSMQTQYMTTHPDATTTTDSAGNKTLTGDSLKDFNAYINAETYHETGVNNVSNVYNTKGADAALNTLGADSVMQGATSPGISSCFYNAGAGGTNVKYENIASLKTSELNDLVGKLSTESGFFGLVTGVAQDKITGLSDDEVGKIKTTVTTELNRRAAVIKNIEDSTSLTDDQKAALKAKLGLLDTGWTASNNGG